MASLNSTKGCDYEKSSPVWGNSFNIHQGVKTLYKKIKFRKVRPSFFKICLPVTVSWRKVKKFRRVLQFRLGIWNYFYSSAFLNPKFLHFRKASRLKVWFNNITRWEWSFEINQNILIVPEHNFLTNPLPSSKGTKLQNPLILK